MGNMFGRKGKIKKGTIQEIVFIAMCVLLPCFTFLVYAPIQLYVANTNEFWFTMPMIAGPIAVCMVAAFLILFAIGMLLKKKQHRYLYGAFFFGLGVAIFVQGDYINLNLGVLNGAQIIWSNYDRRFAINAMIWAAIVLGSLIAAWKTGRNYIMPACIGVAVVLFLQLVTLFVLGLSGEKKNNSYDYILTTKNLYTLSEKDNVVVFLMDMFDSRYLDELIAQNDPVLDDYDNFIYYRNHTGSYSTTGYSLGHLFLNDYIDNTYPTFKEALNTQYTSEKNVFPILEKQGCALDIYCPFPSLFPDVLYQASSAVEWAKYTVNDPVGFVLKLYKLCATKFAPDLVKPYVWMDSNAFDVFKGTTGGNDVYPIDNISLHQLLQDKQIVKDDVPHFKFIYGTGAHYPYINDENFNPIEHHDDFSMEGAVGAAKSVLKICSQYMDMMKEAGVYDNTTIIIMADHGFYWDGVLTNPLMMVKPRNSQAPFAISDAPTSQMHFQGTVAAAMGYDDGKYGVPIWSVSESDTSDRFFYQYYLQENPVAGKYRLIEYRILPEGNERKMFSLTDREIGIDGTEVVHHEHCEYCEQNGMEPQDFPNDKSVVHSRK